MSEQPHLPLEPAPNELAHDPAQHEQHIVTSSRLGLGGLRRWIASRRGEGLANEPSDLTSTDYEQEVHQVYNEIHKLIGVDGEFAASYRSALKREKTSQDHYDEISALVDKKYDLQSELVNRADKQRSAQINEERAELEVTLRQFGPDVDAMQVTRDRLKDFSRSIIKVSSDSEIAQNTLNLIKRAIPAQHVSLQKAPFRDFKENTETMTKFVSSAEVGEFLGEKRFFRKGYIGDKITGYTLDITPDNGEQTIAVPANILIDVARFNSWQGRGYEGEEYRDVDSPYGTWQAKSIDNSKHYASLPTELPPVDTIQIYVQPNGEVFADNGNGDSHRIAAALLRGQQEIQAKSVTVQLLSENILPEVKK